MSSVHEKSEVASPPLLVCAMMFLDPRRWVGAVIAALGVLVSVVAPFVPAPLLRRICPPAGDAPAPRHVPNPRRPLPTPVQSSAVATSRRKTVRPRTSGDTPLSPHVTFSFGPHPRSVSASSLHGSTSRSSLSKIDHGALHDGIDGHSLSSSSPAPLTALLPPESPYFHPPALPSLESLDLASDASPLSTQQSISPSTKRNFRVPLPKLGFGRRRSSTDVNGVKESEQTSDTAAPASTPNESGSDTLDRPPGDGEWRGTNAFAVRRATTIATLSDSAPEAAPRNPIPSRRKFSLFSRDSSSTSSSKEKEKGSPPSPPAAIVTHTEPITPPTKHDAIPPVPALPSPATLQRMVASLPPNALAGPSKSPIPSPVPRVALEDMVPLEQTTTPPARPARTDPYKTYGVPVPGSERARAFLKAEKEWIRAEKERRERERVTRVADGYEEGVRGDIAEGSNHGHGSGEEKIADANKGKASEHMLNLCPGAPKKGKDPIPVAEKPSTVGHVEDGNEADMEHDKSDVETHRPEEFGVRPVVGAPTSSSLPARPASSHGKRSWVFSRRSSDVSGEKEEKRRERRERDKEKEKEKQLREKDKVKDKGDKKEHKDNDKVIDKDSDPAKSKKRPKSRDGPKKSLGFRSRERGKGRDRGYSSDTGVPSLTYKLMP